MKFQGDARTVRARFRSAWSLLIRRLARKIAGVGQAVDYEADPLANPSAYSEEEVAEAYARYVCQRCGGLLDVLRVCPLCALEDKVVPWSAVPDRAMVAIDGVAGRCDYFYRVGLVGWWVGGGPDLVHGEVKFVAISPLGNCWPAWSSWTFAKARVVALDLRGDESADRLWQLAKPKTWQTTRGKLVVSRGGKELSRIETTRDRLEDIVAGVEAEHGPYLFEPRQEDLAWCTVEQAWAYELWLVGEILFRGGSVRLEGVSDGDAIWAVTSIAAETAIAVLDSMAPHPPTEVGALVELHQVRVMIHHDVVRVVVADDLDPEILERIEVEVGDKIGDRLGAATSVVVQAEPGKAAPSFRVRGDEDEPSDAPRWYWRHSSDDAADEQGPLASEAAAVDATWDQHDADARASQSEEL